MQGSGFRDQGSGFRVQGLGIRVQGAGFRAQATPSRALGWNTGARPGAGNLDQEVLKAVLLKSTPPQIRQLVICYHCRCRCPQLPPNKFDNPPLPIRSTTVTHRTLHCQATSEYKQPRRNLRSSTAEVGQAGRCSAVLARPLLVKGVGCRVMCCC